ncbi:hypothetical protein K2173_015287 [Erythroxylum novogranatense]|uniref:Gag protein n=1 Tax=Erythroxylum novogranatense TaxID=1862640 RepID=A0AAV8T2Y4_9ROSI|nr:hypothetical protein K2173_015287 [Erythroxylum novogranatense]
MRLFIESTHVDHCDVIENGPYTPVDEEGNSIPRNRWMADQKARIQLNSKAKFFLTCALSRSEYDKVHGCDTAKEMWETLSIAHEGTSQVKESKISILVHQYELFRMEDEESIDQMFGRFQTIVNGLKALGRTYNNQDHVRKILRSLPKRWRPKVTLQIHEVELNAEDKPKRDKSIALKAGQKNHKTQRRRKSSKALKIEESKDDNSSQSESDSSDEDDELSFISVKIRRCGRKSQREPTFVKNGKDEAKP